MWGLIVNELQKMAKRKKPIITILAFVVLVGLIDLLGITQSSETTVQNNIKMFESIIKNNKKTLQTGGLSKEQVTAIKNSTKQLQGVINKLSDDEADRDMDWKKRLDKIILQKENEKRRIENAADDTKIEALNKEINEDQYLVNNNIKDMSNTDIKGYAFAMNVVGMVGAIFVPLILAVLTSDAVSGECSPPTMKMLLTKPISRGKILMSKFMATIIMGVGAIMSVHILNTLFIGIVYGFGSAKYPVSVGTLYRVDTMKAIGSTYGVSAIIGSSHIIPMWQYMLEVIGLQFLFIACCIAFAFLISTIFKSNVISTITSVLGILVLTIFTPIVMGNTTSDSLVPFKKILSFVFLSYSNTESLLKGEVAVGLNSTMVTPIFAALVMVAWIVVCYAIAHVVFTKKEMLV